MRKKLFIGVLSITFILLGLILSINQAFALDDTIAYTFDDESFTGTNGTSLDVDGSSQVFTLTGTNGSASSNDGYILTSPLTVENTSLSSLDPLKSYIVIYEYLSGTFPTNDAILSITMNDGMSTYTEYAVQTFKIHKTNYQEPHGILLPPGLTSAAKVKLLAAPGAYNLSFKLNIYEYTESANFIDLFSSTYNTTENGVTVDVSNGDTIEVHGTASSVFEIDLSSVLTTLDPQKLYLFKYVYVSGSITNQLGMLYLDSYPDVEQTFLSFDNLRTLNNRHQPVHSLVNNGDITQISVVPSPYLENTATNFTYQILVEEITLGSTPEEPTDGYDIADWNQVNSYLVYDIVNNLPTAVDDVANIYFNPLFVTSDYEFAASSDLTHQPVPEGTTGIKLIQTIDQAMTVHYQIVFHPSDEIIMISETNPDAAWNNISIRLAVTPSIVNYYVDGVIDSTVNSTVGEKLTKPTDPVLTGYTFIGWYLEDTYTTLFDFNTDTIASETFNLYARFVADTTDVFTVSFNENGGSLVDDRLVVSGESIDAPVAPTKSGYTFNGWFTDVELTAAYDFTSTITADTTLYAKWTESATTPVTPNEASLGVVEWVFISLGAAAVGYAIYFGKKK